MSVPRLRSSARLSSARRSLTQHLHLAFLRQSSQQRTERQLPRTASVYELVGSFFLARGTCNPAGAWHASSDAVVDGVRGGLRAASASSIPRGVVTSSDAEDRDGPDGPRQSRAACMICAYVIVFTCSRARILGTRRAADNSVDGGLGRHRTRRMFADCESYLCGSWKVLQNHLSLLPSILICALHLHSNVPQRQQVIPIKRISPIKVQQLGKLFVLLPLQTRF